ncbi:MAG: ester cyclase [bacterium]|nr:ester cyclase [bacterium]
MYHIPPYPDAKGLEAYKERVKMYRSAYPDLKLTVDGEIVIQGNHSALRWTITGTHTNPIPSIPIPPTGKQIVIKGCDMGLWKDGKIIEEWNYADFMGYMKRFGFKLVPPMMEEEKKEGEMKEEEKKDAEM